MKTYLKTYNIIILRRFHSSVGQSMRLLTAGSRVRSPLEPVLRIFLNDSIAQLVRACGC